MPSFSESLTVRILGDSSQFQRELESVTRMVSGLRSQLDQLTSANVQVGNAVARVSGFVQPLQAISRLFDQISIQAQTMSSMPITLNVQPALSALSFLSQLIDYITLKMRSLSGGFLAAGGGDGGSVSAAGGGVVPVPVRYASGGLVAGPAGLDQVPAMLTAGEFVMRQPAVEQLGVSFLNALNQVSRTGGSTPASPIAVGAGKSTVNHFGGISINVSRPVDINAVVRDLRFQGFHLRNRRG